MNIPEVLRALDAQIAQLQQARQLLSGSASAPAPSVDPAKRRGRPSGPAKAAEAKPAGKRTVSEEGRARIAAAQKKRWAKSKRAAKAAVLPVAATKAAAPAKKATVKKKVAAVEPVAPAKVAAKKVTAPVKKADVKKAAIKKAAVPVKQAKPAKVMAKKTVPAGQKRATNEAARGVDPVEPIENTAPAVAEEEVTAEE